jgi:hypothetical protein
MENNLIDKELTYNNTKIKVYWDDVPENYSKEAKRRIQKDISKKYKTKLENIKVEFRPVRKSDTGEMIKIDGASIDNILDYNYQRELFKEWLQREGKDVDFDRLVSLDNRVNSELDSSIESLYNTKKWGIKWISINNFLSFGEGNHFPVDKYKGLTVVNSIPENQGGKCIRSNTKITIQYNIDEIIRTIGFLPDELK